MWRILRLLIQDRIFTGQFIEIVTLKSPQWMNETGATPGVRILYDLPDMGIHGPAEVLAVEPCPEIKPGMERAVLRTNDRTVNNVTELRVDGLHEPIEVTANHPFFSADRIEWVAAGKLSQGEAVMTLTSSAQVTTVFSGHPVRQVWNFEAEGEHIYVVTISGVLARNSYSLRGATPPRDGKRLFLFDRKTGTVWVGNAGEGTHRSIAWRLDFDEHLPEVFENLVGGHLTFVNGKATWQVFSEYVGGSEARKDVLNALKELFS